MSPRAFVNCWSEKVSFHVEESVEVFIALYKGNTGCCPCIVGPIAFSQYPGNREGVPKVKHPIKLDQSVFQYDLFHFDCNHR